MSNQSILLKNNLPDNRKHIVIIGADFAVLAGKNIKQPPKLYHHFN